MARIDNLTNFLTDVATAIRTKKDSEATIAAEDFDTEILSLPSQGVYQDKSMNITTNGNYRISPDTGYDAITSVDISVTISPNLQDVTLTQNGTYRAGQEYDGIGEIIVNVPAESITILNVEDGEVDGTTLIVDVDDIYKELEYIESTGTQYIDTNVLCKSSLRCQLKFSTTKHSGNCYIGGMATNEEDSFRVFTFNNKWYLDFGSGEYHNRIKGGSANINTVYNIEIGNRYIKDLDTETNIISDSVVSSFSKVYNCLLSSPTEELTIYNCKIYDNDVLIRDFIPVRMNYNNAVGMYDKVNNLFYGNVGTGSFIAGPEID